MQFNSANDLTVHYNDIHEGPTNFQCQTCGKNFTNNRNLMKHIKRIHDPLKEEKIKVKKDIRCDICNKSFSENRDLNRHKMSPCYIKDIRCDICKMLFDSAKDLTVHYDDVHEGLTKYQCKFCGKNF